MESLTEGKKKNLSRFIPEPSKAPAISIQKRDIEIILYLNKFRYLTIRQIQKRFFKSYQRASKRLELLFHHRLINRVYVDKVNRLTKPTYHQLTAGNLVKIKKLLKDQGKLHWLDDLNGLKLRARPKQRASGAFYFLKHAEGTAEFFINLELAPKRQGLEVIFFELENADELYEAADLKYPRKRISFRPDGFFCLKDNKRLSFFFLEIDNATMPLSTFREKLKGYQAFYLSGKFTALFKKLQHRFDFEITRTDVTPRFRLLVVGLDENWCHNLALLSKDPSTYKMSWFTSFDRAADPETILDSIWISGKDCTALPDFSSQDKKNEAMRKLKKYSLVN